MGSRDGWIIKDEERNIRRGRDIKRTVLFWALSLLQSLLCWARATVGVYVCFRVVWME